MNHHHHHQEIKKHPWIKLTGNRKFCVDEVSHPSKYHAKGIEAQPEFPPKL